MIAEITRLTMIRKSSLLLTIFSFFLLGCAQNNAFNQAEIVFPKNNIQLTVEFADTKKLRQQGLMHRESMCEQCGMLFQYDSVKRASMWMKNTHIALDVAFITKRGIITDIKPMQPLDLTSIKSSEKVLYALEMNQGWFAKNRILVGDKLILVKQTIAQSN